MAVKAMRLVGLDVHARQTHAAMLDTRTGEVGVSRLRMAPEWSRTANSSPPIRASSRALRKQLGLKAVNAPRR